MLLLYTWKPFLEEQFQSLRGLQSDSASPADVELIIVDNGSPTVDSVRIAEDIKMSGLAPARVITVPPGRGFSAGMNAGIAQSSGDLVIALNSDCLLGAGLMAAMATTPLADDVGFLAPAVYDWLFQETPRVSERTARVQGQETALTFHGSCTPAGPSGLRPDHVLGPMGPCVVLTRKLIDALTRETGCVFDDEYFSFYGEDCELFLAAKRLGFRTVRIQVDLAHGVASWHIGSATTNNGINGTITFQPALAAAAIRSFLGNCYFYSGWLELPMSMSICVACHAAFVASYALRHGPKAALLLLVRLLLDRRTRRRSLRRALGCRFLSQAAVLGFRVVPWAKLPRSRAAALLNPSTHGNAS